jgi:chromosome segregation ATPase
MSKFIPVEPEKWAEMVKAQAENARLKAEVERLTSDIQMEKENEDRLVREWQKANNEVYGLQTQVAALIDDQTRLKAELAKSEEHNAALCERMQDLNSELHTCSCANANMNKHKAENARLKAEVERLTKAGDLMCRMAGNNQVINRHWKTAKKGVQS